MTQFNFEKNLTHQSHAVESTTKVFENIGLTYPQSVNKHYINPTFNFESDITYKKNIENIQYRNAINSEFKKSNIIDISMETGTGKTYTYTKTIFELNKLYGIFKFIVVVPTLSIKAGTVNFLKSDSCREHFKEQYGKTLKLHIVESQKSRKNKKSFIPSAVSDFVKAGNYERDKIQILIINTGMVNSPTMGKSFDTNLFDKYSVPFDALATTQSFIIIDEPHKFPPNKTTWTNIQQIQPQIILRYGATFSEYENLIYKLSSIDSFNQNLVKGVIGHILNFSREGNTLVKLISIGKDEAHFELIEGTKKKNTKLVKKESLSKIHSEMRGLTIENMNTSIVVLSNGLELKKGDKIDVYSYAETVQELMIKNAISKHFEKEKELLTREVKIKPLTLFFIDNIEEYRNKDGYIRKTIEQSIEAQINEILKTENNVFYQQYLQKTLKDIAKSHGGYFSKDNSEKDEAIEKEVNEILHDKESLLDLNNPRRFIFSKWTLREGWDNPNVFQICKLRSSGSETSKLQEVGRGLRLPVNEYGNRVKDEQFYLNYFVDFTESDFVDKLINEVNQKSGAISMDANPEKLSDEMIEKILEVCGKTKNELLQDLIKRGVVDYTHEFEDGGFEYIKQNYPLIFSGVNSNKIINSTEESKKVVVRVEKYKELKELWEKLNEKVILEYGFKDESDFKKLFTNFIEKSFDEFEQEKIYITTETLEIKNNKTEAIKKESVYDTQSLKIANMQYSQFITELSQNLTINIKTIHQSFIDCKKDINPYLNQTTLKIIKEKFKDYLLANAINKFAIEYKRVKNQIHPTKLTDINGEVFKEIAASSVGRKYLEESVDGKYLLDQLYFDSDLEKENIQKNIDEVIVFTKIPKGSINIPVCGGGSYSPDFAYVLKMKDGEQKLNFIVETKGYDGSNKLRKEEKQKIKHAEKYFSNKIDVKFTTQFNTDKIINLINEVYEKCPT